jgi:hypothetical protein
MAQNRGTHSYIHLNFDRSTKTYDEENITSSTTVAGIFA